MELIKIPGRSVYYSTFYYTITPEVFANRLSNQLRRKSWVVYGNLQVTPGGQTT